MAFERPDHWRVLEGLMTTLGDGGVVNIAPMGPVVSPGLDQLIFRPFRTSRTYGNLKASGCGVFHVTDDALMLARGAIGQVKDAPTRPADHVDGVVLTGACRYYEVLVDDLDDREDRTTIRCRVVHVGRLRDFFGFNRAMHAVLEAAILATRLHLTGAAPVLAEFARLNVIVEKTGAPAEAQAMAELTAFVEAYQPHAAGDA
jgi:hypothetical protein